ncbi:tRNA adenylyltransferase [Aspergillus undulatus]|uniref:tRNA adenylyltransferase n=1 Tax=Aspergillus undulatus TaxID=1810928 RepID=UPI003CCD2C29
MSSVTDGTLQQLPTIELTPLENRLKTLLLDVARHIQDRDGLDGRSDRDDPQTVLRFTGGWVRDKLLGVGSHDIDVAINNMTGYQFGLKLKEYLDIPGNLDKYRQSHEKEGEHKHVSLHKIEANPEKSKHLETVTTKIFGFDVDLVNLRKEEYAEDSRTPQMQFGTATEDALRRDATINALFYNLNESKVEDLTGKGLEDMQDEIVRTPLEPYQTFKDDPLRVLRLIRFASRLGFRIEAETENAMQHSDIGTALKLKISRERVGVEVEKMLRGPDPRGALDIIDRLNLYSIIFANYQDDAAAEMTSWSLAYNALHRLLSSNDESPAAVRVRKLLVRDTLEEYYSWVIAAFVPWSTIRTRPGKGKPLPPRMAEAARDGLRGDNKMIAVLKNASTNWRSIIEFKTAFLEGKMQGTAAEIRQQVGLQIRSWGTDWRLCILLSIFREIMQGCDFAQVVNSYNQFLSYIVEQDLENMCDLKPIVNGGDIMRAFDGKKGPYLAKALKFVIEWQLLHPDIQDKQEALEDLKKLRNAAREAIRSHEALKWDKVSPIPASVLSSIKIPEASVNHLWREISSNDEPDNARILGNLSLAEGFLGAMVDSESLSDADKNAGNSLYAWLAGHALPSPLTTSAAQDESRQRSSLALKVISLLNNTFPINETENQEKVILALASFTSATDPWTTDEAYEDSNAVLKAFSRNTEPSSFWWTIEAILKTRVRPLFAKTRNPAITEFGRKNFHPVPLPRFDLSILDPETKPWKNSDAYITTVFSWIISQYNPTDIEHLEAHVPLLIPPILALIDDDGISYKRRGCTLLSQFLGPIRKSKSEILRRTNLVSVFEDAIRPCFHSLPTITPEDDSIQLLSAAYPALRSLLQTSYRQLQVTDSRSSANQQKDKDTFITTTTQTLRGHLIPSFHHISSTDPTSASSFASFPHTRLSTFLLNQIAITCTDLRIHTTKYLQDIIPLVYSTLSNPFGTAHPPLLLAALSAARAVILNAYPRIWRWRGEILGAVCSCWLHVTVDEVDSLSVGSRATQLNKLKKELQGVVYLLKYALENPSQADSDQGQREAKENIEREIQMLVDADDSLRPCLLPEIDSDDPKYFGLDG